MTNKNDLAISVRDLHKSFRLPHETHSGLKQLIVNFWKRKKGYEIQQVLNGVDFDIKKGEFFGIVGRNGSGKSTLLKCMAGIYSPDKGAVSVNGTLTPFIELGVGFNPDLTGRENVYMNGALFGFSNEEMDVMYDEIVEFAELERFMDQKLKNYSSGMQVRLAFSIAIRAKGDILLLDEVLAVGDEAFQRKCYEYFYQLKKEHKTVILVTHSMSTVESFCTRALFLEEGAVKNIGNTHEVASAYSESNNKSIAKNVEQPYSKAKKAKSGIVTKTYNFQTNQLSKVFQSGDDLIIRLTWEHDLVRNAGVAIIKSDGYPVYATNTFIEGKEFTEDKKSVDYKVKLNIIEGEYIIKVGLSGDGNINKIAFDDDAARILINKNKNDIRWGGITKLESEWI